MCVSVCTGCYLLTVEDPERRVLGNLSEPGIFQGPGETVAFRPDVPELLAVWLPRLSLPALSGSRGWALCATGSLCWLAGTSGLLGLPGVAPPFRLESVWEVLELLDGERVESPLFLEEAPLLLPPPPPRSSLRSFDRARLLLEALGSIGSPLRASAREG